MTPADPLRAAAHMGGILESLGIRYVVGGSLASSIHGEPRLTIDLDVMIEVDEDSAVRLTEALGGTFYADPEAARDAVSHVSTFNVVDLETALKIDFFIAENDPAVEKQLERRIAVHVDDDTVYVYAPEDILVRKLRWFRLGGETSERQWRDILGILRISGSRMDLSYLDEAASHFEVLDLLKRAQGETPPPSRMM